jgi:hypothetical protein
VTVITRLRLDAARYDPAPADAGLGRPRQKGKRLPTPQPLMDDPTTAWIRGSVVGSNHPLRAIELRTPQAVWDHTGQPPVPIRFRLIRDVAGTFDPQALLATDPALDPLAILVFFKRGGQMEPPFRPVREDLGVETQRPWSAKAIARTTPAL